MPSSASTPYTSESDAFSTEQGFYLRVTRERFHVQLTMRIIEFIRVQKTRLSSCRHDRQNRRCTSSVALTIFKWGLS